VAVSYFLAFCLRFDFAVPDTEIGILIETFPIVLVGFIFLDILGIEIYRMNLAEN